MCVVFFVFTVRTPLAIRAILFRQSDDWNRTQQMAVTTSAEIARYTVSGSQEYENQTDHHLTPEQSGSR